MLNDRWDFISSNYTIHGSGFEKKPKPIILKSWPDHMYLYPCLSSCFKVQNLIKGDLMHHVYFTWTVLYCLHMLFWWYFRKICITFILLGQYSIVYKCCSDGTLERYASRLFDLDSIVYTCCSDGTLERYASRLFYLDSIVYTCCSDGTLERYASRLFDLDSIVYTCCSDGTLER